jgi:hypothetical protein
MSSIAGELVTERLVGYDGGRQVTVYVPPTPAEAVVFAANHHCVHHAGNSAGPPPNRVFERHTNCGANSRT